MEWSYRTEWLVLPRVNIEWFNQALDVSAQQTGAGVDKQILLVLERVERSPTITGGHENETSFFGGRDIRIWYDMCRTI